MFYLSQLIARFLNHQPLYVSGNSRIPHVATFLMDVALIKVPSPRMPVARILMLGELPGYDGKPMNLHFACDWATSFHRM